MVYGDGILGWSGVSGVSGYLRKLGWILQKASGILI